MGCAAVYRTANRRRGLKCWGRSHRQRTGDVKPRGNRYGVAPQRSQGTRDGAEAAGALACAEAVPRVWERAGEGAGAGGSRAWPRRRAAGEHPAAGWCLPHRVSGTAASGRATRAVARDRSAPPPGHDGAAGPRRGAGHLPTASGISVRVAPDRRDAALPSRRAFLPSRDRWGAAGASYPGRRAGGRRPGDGRRDARRPL